METKFSKFGVETKPGVTNVAVETKFSKLAVLTWLRRFGVETNPGVTNVAVETKLSKLGDEINPKAKLRRF